MNISLSPATRQLALTFAGRTIRRSLLAGIAGVALCFIVSLIPLGTGVNNVAGATKASSARPTIAAEYFGNASPINFWTSDLSGAKQAFLQMKADGFNTVGLLVPWGTFEPQVSPAHFSSAAFARLTSLISIAASVDMRVILRLSYEWDVDPADQMPGVDRIVAAFGNQKVYDAWLGYIAKVHSVVAKFSNVEAHYVSWEDFWYPVQLAQEATTDGAKLSLATSIGFRTWLQSQHSLSQVSALYGQRFTRWSEVPTPSYGTPNFALMYEFMDWMMIHHFFTPANERYPGFTMETRVDVDPLYKGTTVVGSYSHADTYQLPGTSITGMYFSPYMSDPSSSLDETAPQALTALRSTLSSMSSKVGGRQLFIYEYEIVSNSPQVNDDPNMTPGQVPLFLAQSAPLLEKYTSGYALWTYRDFNLSEVYNPSFTLGTSGWTIQGPANVSNATGTASYVTLGSGASASQTLGPEQPGSSLETLSIQAAAVSGPTSLTIAVGATKLHTFQIGAGWATYSLEVPQAELAYARVSFEGSGPIRLTDLQAYNFTQLGDVYNANDAPEIGAAPLRALNQTLANS